MNRLRQRDFWLWSLAVLAVVLNAGIGSYNVDQMVVTQSAVLRAQSRQAEWIVLLSDIKDAETGHRGFLLTGKPDYLEPFRKAEVSRRLHIDTLQELTQKFETQQDRLDDLETVIDDKFKEMHRTIAVFNRSGRDAAATELTNDHGKTLMDNIRRRVSDALEEEQQILQIRHGEARDQIRVARIASLAAAALAIGIILIAAALIRSELRRRREAHTALLAAQTQLEGSFTAVKESESRYRTLSNQLESLVLDRTAELKEQAQLLKTSNEELEKFAYIASHDLQEPLRKIQAFGDRLLRKHKPLLDDDGQESIDRMLDAAARMRRLIEDLLAFSRVSSQVKPFEPVNLNDVLAEVVSVFQVRLEANGGTIAFEDLPTLPGDESQLRQLFQNLIGNAIKFASPERPPIIRIDAVVFDALPGAADPPRPSGAGWRIHVTDNGIGFEQQYAGRIFELFQRLHGRQQYEGTGLGLAICRKIAQRHGITLDVRSVPDRGTTFILDWPQRSPTA